MILHSALLCPGSPVDVRMVPDDALLDWMNLLSRKWRRQTRPLLCCFVTDHQPLSLSLLLWVKGVPVGRIMVPGAAGSGELEAIPGGCQLLVGGNLC